MEAAKGLEGHADLIAELRHDRLKLSLMEKWKKRVIDTDRKAATALFHVVEMKGDLGQVTQNRNEFDGMLKKIEAVSECRVICLDRLLLKHIIWINCYESSLSSQRVLPAASLNDLEVS